MRQLSVLKIFSHFQLFCQFSEGSGFFLPWQKWSSGFVAFPSMILLHLFLMVSTIESYMWRFGGHASMCWKTIENTGSLLPSGLQKSLTVELPPSSPLVFLISFQFFLQIDSQITAERTSSGLGCSPFGRPKPAWH